MFQRWWPGIHLCWRSVVAGVNGATWRFPPKLVLGMLQSPLVRGPRRRCSRRCEDILLLAHRPSKGCCRITGAVSIVSIVSGVSIIVVVARKHAPRGIQRIEIGAVLHHGVPLHSRYHDSESTPKPPSSSSSMSQTHRSTFPAVFRQDAASLPGRRLEHCDATIYPAGIRDDGRRSVFASCRHPSRSSPVVILNRRFASYRKSVSTMSTRRGDGRIRNLQVDRNHRLLSTASEPRTPDVESTES
jgi:hypothetical protein